MNSYIYFSKHCFSCLYYGDFCQHYLHFLCILSLQDVGNAEENANSNEWSWRTMSAQLVRDFIFPYIRVIENSPNFHFLWVSIPFRKLRQPHINLKSTFNRNYSCCLAIRENNNTFIQFGPSFYLFTLTY